MRVSIIIPALNEAEGIEAILQPLQLARQVGHQLLLVDGGSHDATIALARPLVDAVLLSAPGRAIQMNTGAAQANGDILWFLHADTRVSTDSVATVQQAVQQVCKPVATAQVPSEQRRSTAICADCWGRFDISIDSRRWPYRVIEFMMNLRSRVTSVATGDQGIFVTQLLFKQHHGFAPIALMEDIELCKRLRRTCKPVNLSHRVTTSSRRWDGAGLLPTLLLMWGLRLAYVCGVSPERLKCWYRAHKA